MLPAPKTPGLLEEAIEWPKLKHAVQKNPLALEKIQLKCPVCLEMMTVNSNTQGGPDADRLSHSARVACCGHIFGTSCFLKQLDRKPHEGNRNNCPLCDESWKHSGCHHLSKGRKLTALLKNLGNGPKTIHEGAKLSEQCPECAIGTVVEAYLVENEPRMEAAHGSQLKCEEEFGLAVRDGTEEVYHSARVQKLGGDVLETRDWEMQSDEEKKMQRELLKQLKDTRGLEWSDIEPVFKITAWKWTTPWKGLQSRS